MGTASGLGDPSSGALFWKLELDDFAVLPWERKSGRTKRSYWCSGSDHHGRNCETTTGRSSGQFKVSDADQSNVSKRYILVQSRVILRNIGRGTIADKRKIARHGEGSKGDIDR